MEYMPEFDIHRPASIDEAVALQRAHPGARLLAGGTDIVPNIRRGIVAAPALIDLSGLAALRNIEIDDDGGATIGAGVTLAELIAHADIAARWPCVVEAAAEVAAPTHREVATVGGNLCLDTRCVFYNQSEWWRRSNDYCLKYRGETCHVAPAGNHCFAAFSGDLAPALMALGARVEIAGPDGVRDCALDDIYADDGAAHLRLDAAEILVAVKLAPASYLRTGYAKARVRGAIDFPLAGVAIALAGDAAGLSAFNVVLTGTNSCPLRLAGTEALIGQNLDDDAIAALLKLVAKQIQPMTSTFVTPGYRRRVIANLTRVLATRLFDAA